MHDGLAHNPAGGERVMTLSVLPEALTVENTVQVSGVRHRLALGVQWVDAVSQLSVGNGWVSDLDAIGTRPCPLRFDVHPRGRHALRAAGRLAKLLALAAADKIAMPPPTVEDDQTNFVLRAYSRRSARVERYTTGNDARRYVPRRLSLTPVQTDGIPTIQADNIRDAWAWPGSAFPLASKVTALRGWVRRGANEASAKPVAWPRIAITQPGMGPPNFATEVNLGFAHGDDRGEFLAVLGPDSVPGGVVLPPAITLRIWVFLPPPDLFDPADPLASLPLEVAGTAAISDVTRGTAVPAGYLQQNSFDVIVAPGRVVTIDKAKLLF